jgi:pentatricopeptide repeat protein
MILVDSSVWIDYFRGIANPPADRLQSLLGKEEVLVADLVLVEVLQGYGREGEFKTALDLMSRMEAVTVGGVDVAIAAARNFRSLRAKGVTVRKTIDTLIATRCIMDGLPLLYSDRDFDPFVEHLGLMSALG